MRLLKYLSALILILSTTACSALLSESQSTIKVTLSNQTEFDVCEIYLSTEKANDWGENKLSVSETLPAGGEKILTVKRGTYDLLVRTCMKVAVYSYHGVDQDFTAVIGGQGYLPIRALNTGRVEICFVYIVPAGTGAWGDDQLGGVESILPGSSRLFFAAPGLYNLRADDCNKNRLSEVENFDPAAGLDWGIHP